MTAESQGSLVSLGRGIRAAHAQELAQLVPEHTPRDSLQGTTEGGAQNDAVLVIFKGCESITENKERARR